MNDKSVSLRDLATAFVLYKQSLGYIYNTQERYLLKYISFSEDRYPEHQVPCKDAVNELLANISVSKGNLYGIVCALREFSRYLILRGYLDAYMIPAKTTSQPEAEPPYFFTEAEIVEFFNALDNVQLHSSFKGRELVLPAMFRLIYCCGLRCKEICFLQCNSVNLANLYLDIKESKGPKSRRIFITEELADYLNIYDSAISKVFFERTYFFPCVKGHYNTSVISNNFKRFWHSAFPDFPKEIHPRAYDFRHHFAWANLNRWAAEGLDINAMIPYLMRYMGHKSIKETLYYFHFVPEFFPTYNSITEKREDILPEVPYEE